MLDNNMCVLVVDDQTSMRGHVRNVLKSMGFQNIVEAENGAEAARILNTHHVDFIISDWNMPMMNGLELLKHVRSDPKRGNTPFLMLTGQSERKEILLAVAAKVNNYLVKPFTSLALEEKIAAIFGGL